MSDLPAGWMSARLGDVFRWSSGGTPKSTDASFYGGQIPWAVIGDLNEGIVTDTAMKISESGLENSAAKWVEPGSVLIAMYGSIGKAAIAGARLTTNQAIAFADPKPIPAKYLFWFIKHRQAKIYSLGKGATQKNISQTVLNEVPFPIAPLSEQVRIVEKLEELLSDLDAGVSALERARVNLKRYRAAVLKAAVEGRLTEKWRAAHPDVEPSEKLLERILAERRRKWEEAQLKKFAEKKQAPPKGWKEKYPEPVKPDVAELPKLSEGWCWATIDQIADVQGGIQKQPKRAPKDNSFPYIRVGNVLRGRLDLSRLERFELFEGELERLRLEPDDLLVVEGNGSKSEIGRCAIWRGEVQDCVHQNHIIRVRPFSGLAGFVLAYWNSLPGSQRVMKQAASTSGLYTLSVQKVSALAVPLPPITEQVQVLSQVEQQLSVLERQVSEIEAHAARSARLRQAILKRAFEGKLVSQDPKDEPASDLLARIRAERGTQGALLKGRRKGRT